MSKTKSYNADSMKHYEGLSAIRKRPSMFIGDTESEYSPVQLVLEVVTNSVDEAMNGYGDLINVTFDKEGYCSVKDKGRGIPFEDMMINGKKMPACVAIATTLNTGGKFNDEGDGAYKTAGGLNGIGLKATTALSEHLILTTTRDGKQMQFEAKLGKVSKALHDTGYKPKKNETGTEIRFKLDKSIIKVTDFSVVKKQIKENCKITAYLNKGLTIKVKFFDEKEESYFSKNGISDLITDKSANAKCLYDPLKIAGKHEGVEVEICFTHTNSDQEEMLSFVNGLKVPLGGTHVTGFRLSMTKIFTDFIKKNKIYGKNELEISGDDVREGMIYAVAVKLNGAKFHGQTKDSLGSREAQSATQTLANQFFENLTNEQPNLAKTIALRIVAAAKGRIAAKKAREAVRKNTLEGGNLGLPTKLKDCISTDPKESELWICEGNSASGSAEAGRDVTTQAILALRGKILNTQNEDITKMLKNAEIQSIVAAFGCGIGESFDISKLRYHKIISMTDADVDGSHIKTLLLTLLYQYFKPLIEKGYVYFANSPLYIIKQGGKILGYLKDEAEKEDYILKRAQKIYSSKVIKRYSDLSQKQISECTQKLKFNYIKGLGEMNPEELSSTTMNKSARILTRVTIKDAETAEESFRILMDSKAVEERKAFIQENALFANLDV